MKALNGTPQINADKAFEAGCDLVMFSRPDIEEMRSVIEIAPSLNLFQLSLIETSPEVSSDTDTDSLQQELNKILYKYNIIGTAPEIDPTERHF